MKQHICFIILLQMLCTFVFIHPLRAQQTQSPTAPDTTTLGIGFTLGGYGSDRVDGGALVGGIVRFFPLNSWFTMDIRVDLGIGMPDEGRDTPMSFHGMVCMNGYSPLRLRWNAHLRDGVPMHNELIPYVSLGFGAVHFGGFSYDRETNFSRTGGVQSNLSFAFEIRYNRNFIFCVEPFRWHKLNAYDLDGYNSVKFGFTWVGRFAHAQTQ